jgi:hemerythrin-like domain-containing protein
MRHLNKKIMGKIVITVPQELNAEYEALNPEDAVEIIAFLKKHAEKKNGGKKKLSGIWKARFEHQSAATVAKELRENIWRRF